MAIKKIIAKTVAGSIDTFSAQANDIFFDPSEPNKWYKAAQPSTDTIPLNFSLVTPTFEFTGSFKQDMVIKVVSPVSAFVLPLNQLVEAATAGPWIEDFDFDSEQIETLFANVVGVSNDIQFRNMDTLTELRLKSIEVLLGSMFITTNPALSLADFTGLKFVGGNIELEGLDGTSFDFSVLDRIGGVLSISGCSNLAIDFPILTDVADIVFDGTDVIPVPALQKVTRDITVNNMITGLTTVSFPAITEIGESIHMNDNEFVTSASFPLLEKVNSASFLNNAALTTISFPSLKEFRGMLQIVACPLNSASVESILVKLASLDGTGDTTAYSNQTLYMSKDATALTSNATAAVAVLEGRGNTVNISTI